MVPGATMMSMSSGVPALTKQMSGKAGGGPLAIGGGIQPRFKDRESLAQLAFSQAGLNHLKKQEGKPGVNATLQRQSMMYGGLLKSQAGMNSFNNRDSSMFMTLDAIQKQVTVAQEVVLDIDFAGIENVRRLYDTLGQEQEFAEFVESDRSDRILKISKLSKSKNLILIKEILIRSEG